MLTIHLTSVPFEFSVMLAMWLHMYRGASYLTRLLITGLCWLNLLIPLIVYKLRVSLLNQDVSETYERLHMWYAYTHVFALRFWKNSIKSLPPWDRFQSHTSCQVLPLAGLSSQHAAYTHWADCIPMCVLHPLYLRTLLAKKPPVVGIIVWTIPPNSSLIYFSLLITSEYLNNYTDHTIPTCISSLWGYLDSVLQKSLVIPFVVESANWNEYT